jgi:hypothetical protein
MRTLLLTVCVVALAPFARAADESYTIELRHYPAPGKSMTVRSSARLTTSVTVKDADGNVVVNERKQKETTQEEWTETTVEGGAKAPKKFKRSYRKASADKGKGAVAKGYEGKVVVFELKGGKYQVSVEGKDEVPPADLDRLATSANNHLKEDLDTVLVPDKAVKVGESWAVPRKKLAELPLPGIDAARSKAEVKLVKAYKKGGKQWGTLQINATLAVRKADKLEFDPPGAVVVEGTLDTPIDGSGVVRSLNATITLSGKATVEEAGRRLSVDLKYRSEIKREREE